MANSLFYTNTSKGVTVNEGGVTGTAQAIVGNDGYVEADAADASLVTRLTEQGLVLVDKAGTEEDLTPGTVQTATTLSAIFMRNGTGTTVLNIRNDDGSGDLLVGPLTIAANAERVIVFPEALSAPDGVFIDVDSGGLLSTGAGEGSLIP
jgi:hypothetical protein